jgi:exodeoxyribonuclease VII large subunit
MDSDLEPRGHRADAPLSISQLNWYLKQLVEQAVPQVWIEGEISDLSRPSSGHMYFTLKDDSCQVRAVIWRSTAQLLKFPLKDGLSIVCCGTIEVYPPRGSYQVIVNRLQPKGIGQLQLAFQELHKKLAKQGLFDAERKKQIPAFPKRIGFVTSPSGAAIHDFLESAEGLWSDFQLFVIPARVQGETAAAEIVRGIRLAQRIRPALDVLIVGRGGGSMEDLWCFNEESVVRALASCSIPTVSAVGHEIDVTLSDLVADARAMTPSQAAGLILPKRSEVLGSIGNLRQRVDSLVRNRLQRIRLHLGGLSSRTVVARPHWLHQRRKQQVDELEKRMRSTSEKLIRFRRQRLGELARATEALSPLGVLQRGYSLTTNLKGRPIRSAEELAQGQQIKTRLASGSVISRVESTES